jgi:hypothetical protein
MVAIELWEQLLA